MDAHGDLLRDGGSEATLGTLEVARRSGYSVQQVRDLERLGVIPAAPRSGNGYRNYTQVHVSALRAYRALAVAAGPVLARRLLRELTTSTVADAAATISALHARLDRERGELLAASAALRAIAAEAAAGLGRAPDPADAMSITELARALGVRTSTLRHWEHEGLLRPDRVASLRVRNYDLRAIRTARIVAALRGAGYGIGAVRDLVARLGHDVVVTSGIVDARLEQLGTRTVALLRAGADLADLITTTHPTPLPTNST
ncbi:MerR family transcriptional regulator [Occultella kanbiaonis]|uniref:MerR family transcriptional regulator n=1 Tax=Occultella kanbiaonis TaxID=2675754 RepID=UPI0012B74460|nr:MerR family transcriptional regulator [Occultella kanbiaonis]